MRFFPSNKLVFTLFVWLFAVASYLDGVLTLILLGYRMTIELNPLLVWVYQVSPLLFVGVKVSLTYGVLLALAYIPDRATQQRVMQLGTLAFTAAVLYQCFLFSLFLRL